MANVAKNAILRAKLAGQITDFMVKTTASMVYVDETTTLAALLPTLAEKASLEALQQTVNALGALAQKDKVSYADLEEALAALIDGKAEASALTEEINRAKAAEEANAAAAAAAQAAAEAAQGDVNEVSGKVNTLIGTDSGKSVRTIANEELAKQLIPENAAESLNELTEIAAWIQSHPGDAAAMNAAIQALQAQLNGIDAGDGTVKKYVDDAIAALKIGDYAKAADLTELAGRVEVNEGDITALKETVAGLGDMATKDIVTEDDLDAELKEKVNSAAEGNHSHANKDLLDTYTQTEADLADAVAKKHAHANQSELDKIADGDKAKWDAAEQNAKDYADDLDEAMDGRMQVVEGKAHEHANKDVLDGISAENVTAWNNKGNIYYSVEEPANLTENDLWFAIIE